MRPRKYIESADALHSCGSEGGSPSALPARPTLARMVDMPAPSGDGGARQSGSDEGLDDDAADERRTRGCVDPREEELARKLAALAQRSDPVPKKVVAAARAALHRRARVDGKTRAPRDQ